MDDPKEIEAKQKAGVRELVNVAERDDQVKRRMDELLAAGEAAAVAQKNQMDADELVELIHHLNTGYFSRHDLVSLLRNPQFNVQKLTDKQQAVMWMRAFRFPFDAGLCDEQKRPLLPPRPGGPYEEDYRCCKYIFNSVAMYDLRRAKSGHNPCNGGAGIAGYYRTKGGASGDEEMLDPIICTCVTNRTDKMLKAVIPAVQFFADPEPDSPEAAANKETGGDGEKVPAEQTRVLSAEELASSGVDLIKLAVEEVTESVQQQRREMLHTIVKSNMVSD